MVFWLVTLHILVSVFLLTYVAVMWHFNKGYIFDNGWNLDYCTPLGEIELVMYFVPIVNLPFSF